MIAEELVVVAEQKNQITGPRHHIQFHEGHDGCVARHGTKCFEILSLTEEELLEELDEIATALDIEDVVNHNHRPKTKCSRKNQIFRFGDDCARSIGQRSNTETMGVIDKQKLNPTGPKQQSAEQSPKCLPRITFGINADNGKSQTDSAHGKGCIIKNGRRHELFHNDHHGVCKRHGKQYDDE